MLVTVVPPELVVPVGELGTVDIAETRETLRRFLCGLGLKTLSVYGALDVSFNVSGGGEWPLHWQLHWSLLVASVGAKDLRRALKGSIQTTPSVRRPVLVREVKKSRAYAFSYVSKAEFWRRTTYRDEQGKLRRSRPQHIPAKYRCELLQFLHSVQIKKRLFRFRPNSNRGLSPTLSPFPLG
jgi:hypothetical protein